MYIYFNHRMSTIDTLLNALENDANSFILQYTNDDINNTKYSVLGELELNENDMHIMMAKLADYVYIDEINHFTPGVYIRWIPLKHPDKISLTRGASVCDVNICEKGTSIVCKNRANKYMQVRMDEAHLFRKLTSQEKVLLSAMSYLKK